MITKSNFIHAAGFNAIIIALFSLVGCIWHDEPELVHVEGKNYYVNAETGDDHHPGSLSSPYKTLEKAGSIDLKAGDTLFLASGSVFYGSLVLNDIHGSEQRPVVVTSLGPGGEKARIDAKGFANGILLENCSNVKIVNIMISADGGRSENPILDMRCGVMVKTTKRGEFRNITLDGLLVQDVFFEDTGFVRDEEESKTSNGTQSYGWGIRFINSVEEAVMDGVVVSNCEVRNVSHTGIKFTGKNKNIRNIQVIGNRVIDAGGPGIQAGNIVNGVFRHNHIDYSGSRKDARNWKRGSGLWTWSSSDVVIEHNTFMNANGPNDSAGCHIDFNCENVVVQYNFSSNNAGGFCEILGNNYNCAYRYNISVNDGHRRKGVDGALQDGRVFWLSGYNGSGNGQVGPFNSYFYNNTVYASKELVSKIAVVKSTRGVLVVNNIFCFEGGAEGAKDGIYTVNEGLASPVTNVVFHNNLYLAATDWPQEVLIRDTGMRVGDPSFKGKGGLNLSDYIPGAAHLVRDQGIEITKIPNDDRGLTVGLKVDRDILGNEITGKPDIGAIEITKQ